MNQTPFKSRTVKADVAQNLHALLRARVDEVNAASLDHFGLPHHAPLIVDPPVDGFGPRLRLLHCGMEISFSLKPGTQVVAQRGTLLTPRILAGVDFTSVIKITHRRAKPNERGAK